MFLVRFLDYVDALCQLPKQHETSHLESKKMEADPKNVAEAFPHTDFSSQVCAEVFPLDS